MEDSITNFELSESTIQVSNPSSDKSDTFEDLLSELPSTELSESNAENNKPEDFDSNLPETVTLLIHPETGAKVYVVGTAHFSEESKEDVAAVIRSVQPNIVVIELCEARTSMLTMDEEKILEEAKNINMDVILYKIRESGVYYGITYLLLLNLSAQITKELGMAPGGEFRVAYKEAIQIPHCSVLLGDRPIKTTLLRALAKLSWIQTIQLAWNLLFSKETISKEEVEKCKQKDMLEKLLDDMTGEYPAVGEVFVAERDIFLTHSLQEAAKSKYNHQGNNEPIKIVGVVGIGHSLGIKKLWHIRQAPFVRDIMQIPPATLTSRLLKTLLKLGVLSLGGYLVYRYVPLPRTLRTTCHRAFERVALVIRDR